MIIVGDVHGKIRRFMEIVKNNPNTKIRQLGDLGFQMSHDWILENCDTDLVKVIFGNHDYYPYLNEKHSMGNFNYDAETGIMTIRGAFSIDYMYRVQGRDWFDNEQMSYAEFLECFDCYVANKPKIVISHECPDEIGTLILKVTGFPMGSKQKTVTSDALQKMFEAHQPEQWFFGHYHYDWETAANGTKFKCLNELSTHFL